MTLNFDLDILPLDIPAKFQVRMSVGSAGRVRRTHRDHSGRVEIRLKWTRAKQIGGRQAVKKSLPEPCGVTNQPKLTSWQQPITFGWLVTNVYNAIITPEIHHNPS